MAVAKKSLFETNLSMSHKDIRGKRAKMANEDGVRSSEDYIRVLSDEKRDLERKLLGLEDFGVNSTTSLKVVNGSFEFSEWIKELNETEWSLKVLNDRLEVANSIHDKFFK